VEQRGRRGREAHRAHLGHDPVVALERDRAHPAADLVGLVDHRLEAHPQQLAGGKHPRQPAADHGHLGAVHRLGDRADPVRALHEVVVREGEVGAEHRDRPGIGLLVLRGVGHR
jgi:hypothetical protein